MHCLVSSSGEMGIRNSPSGPSPSLLLFTDVLMTGWGTDFQDWGERELHINVLEDEGGSACLEHIHPRILGEFVVLMIVFVVSFVLSATP